MRDFTLEHRASRDEGRVERLSEECMTALCDREARVLSRRPFLSDS